VKFTGSGGNNGNNVQFTPAPTPGTITVKGTSPVKAAYGKVSPKRYLLKTRKSVTF
jgi:hypothetical protein